MRKEDSKFYCPKCGTTGVSIKTLAPLCHLCNYTVRMIPYVFESEIKLETKKDK